LIRSPLRKLRIGQDERRCIGLAVAENNIFDIFIDVAREFGEAIRNIMIRNYNSVPRSLRWILETIIFWANMLMRTGMRAKHLTIIVY
jgi:hypothetical protein